MQDLWWNNKFYSPWQTLIFFTKMVCREFCVVYLLLSVHCENSATFWVRSTTTGKGSSNCFSSSIFVFQKEKFGRSYTATATNSFGETYKNRIIKTALVCNRYHRDTAVSTPDKGVLVEYSEYSVSTHSTFSVNPDEKPRERVVIRVG